jgi:hypothetical protein
MIRRRDDLNISPRDKAARAIKEGNAKEALKYLDEVNEQFHHLNDLYSNDVSRAFAKLAEARGEEWLKDFIREDTLKAFPLAYASWKDLTPEQKVEGICAIHRAHYSEFHVEEDDEKFTVAITGCNAGGRLLRDGIAKREGAVTKKAYPWSFNVAGFPYYCIHATFINEVFRNLNLKMEIKWGRQYDDQGQKINEPCRYIVYK